MIIWCAFGEKCSAMSSKGTTGTLSISASLANRAVHGEGDDVKLTAGKMKEHAGYLPIAVDDEFFVGHQ
jgi:hypothetical protein